MLSPEAIKAANQILRDLDAAFSGGESATRQKFKWCWSTDLWALVPVLNDDSGQRYQFSCPCGTDVQVHSASCDGVTQARILMAKCYMVEEYGPLASYRNMWVLCSWNAPPSIEEWRSTMGTDVDYPANGRYLPVFKDGLAVVIPPRARPEEYSAISRMVVRKMVENIEKFRLEQQNKEVKRILPRMDARGNMIEEPHRDSPFWKFRDRIRDARPRFDPTATVGAGGKTGLGHKGTAQIHRSSRSLVDQVARAVDKSNAQIKKELEDALSK